MPALGVVVFIAGLLLVYMGINDVTIGDLARSIFSG